MHLIEPHKKYFNFVKEETDIQVEFLKYDDFKTTRRRVIELMENCQPNPCNPISNFKKITDWIENNDSI